MKTNRKNQIFALFGIIILFSFLSTPTQASLESALTSGSVLLVINQDRMESGIAPLKENPELAEAALAKAHDILKNGYFAHVSPLGKTPWDFIKHTGYSYDYAGENLAINYIDPLELENDLLASPSHRDNLLSASFTEIGIAVVQGNYQGRNAIITVQMFASPKY